MQPEITHDFAQTLPQLVANSHGEDQPSPTIEVLNVPLATELGLDEEWLRSKEGISFLLGHGRSHAMAYAGYQFGQYNPRMGDGRALLLGEISGAELHAKGTGRTPFSRPGSDGRGTLKSMLREYMLSEALHALGIPTTRGLAVISTGRKIQRQTVEPAGVHVRVATSHIRIGTFHYAAFNGNGLLEKLADYAIQKLFPGSSYQELFQKALAAQIATVAGWQRIGFIHGVMNTDNTTISGETIDFGPCAFLEPFDPDTWYSSIDTQGRYRFGNQPAILGWNFARLAESMLPLFDDNPAKAISFAQSTLSNFHQQFDTEYHAQLAQSLGLTGADEELIQEYLEVLKGHDLTNFNAALNSGGAGIAPEWEAKWRKASNYQANRAVRFPFVIPRNLDVEGALGDKDKFIQMLEAVTHPFEQQPRYQQPGDLSSFRTYCGT